MHSAGILEILPNLIVCRPVTDSLQQDETCNSFRSAKLLQAHLNLPFKFNLLFSHVESDMLLCVMLELCLHLLPAGQLLMQLLLAACHLLLQAFGLLAPCLCLKHVYPQFILKNHRAAFPLRPEVNPCQYHGLSSEFMLTQHMIVVAACRMVLLWKWP